MFSQCLLFQHLVRGKMYIVLRFQILIAKRLLSLRNFLLPVSFARRFFRFFSHHSAPKTKCKCSSFVFTSSRGVDIKYTRGHTYLSIFLYYVFSTTCPHFIYLPQKYFPPAYAVTIFAFYLVYTKYVHKKSHLFHKTEFQDYAILHLLCA